MLCSVVAGACLSESPISASGAWLQRSTGTGQQAKAGRTNAPSSSQKASSRMVEPALMKIALEHPASFEAQHNLGEWYLQQGRLKEGILYLTKAEQIAPSNYVNGYDLSLAHINAGDSAKAIELLTRMIQSSDKAELHDLLGEAYERIDDLESAAKENYKRAQMDASEQSIFDLASFFLRHPKNEGSLNQALQFYRYGVATYPRSAKLTIGLGITLYSEGKYEEAVHALCTGVDLDPSDPKPYMFLGRISKASPQAMPEIQRRLEEFVRRYPEDGTANLYYAMSLLQIPDQDPTKIESLLRKAIVKSPGLYEAHFQLGLLYQSQSKYGDARREFTRTIELEPNYSAAHYRLSLVYSRLGQKKEAADELQIMNRLKQKDDELDAVNEAAAASIR
jgi:tetratricopeptide (TPR) repeat protein